MTSVKGVIKKYLFYEDNSGFGIIFLENRETVTGIIPKFQPGQSVEFFGEWIEHPKYGRQFRFENFQVDYPTSSKEIVNFLSSGIVKGLGEKLAAEIVNEFGEDTINILEHNPRQLMKIKGLGSKKIQALKKSWDEKKNLIDLSLYLNKHGIPYRYAVKIERIFGNESLNVIKNNPYKLVNEIWGIGFKEADGIAFKTGFGENNPLRIRAGIRFIMEEAARKGHVFLMFQDLIGEAMSLLKYELAVQDEIIVEMEREAEVVITGYKIYLYELYYYERGIESNLKRINSIAPETHMLSKSEIQKLHGIYSNEQIEAILKSLENKILILTGGPGTGKTETLRGIIEVYGRKSCKILLAAPTGRAAKRMTEIIGRDAKTIHRLLEYNPVYGVFNVNGDNKIEADLLIIDEVSMIDTVLMYRLLEAVGDNTNIIFVGDVHQLPSIGPGNILKDLIESEILPVVTLNKIFRQAEQSEIIKVAHEILDGNISFASMEMEKDFLFIEENDESKIPGIILRYCTERLPQEFGFDSENDIQILCPMHRGVNGTINLNKLLQNGLNSGPVIFKSGHFEYRTGDKVMQLVNDYEKDIYNGDWGFINSVLKDKSVFIKFNDRTVVFKEEDFKQLTLAYSITVHKSQGSEYPCVIMPVVNSHFAMLQRNLLYTAVTRAKKLMIIIGSKNALRTAVNNNRIIQRYTSLFKESPDLRKYIPFEN